MEESSDKGTKKKEWKRDKIILGISDWLRRGNYIVLQFVVVSRNSTEVRIVNMYVYLNNSRVFQEMQGYEKFWQIQYIAAHFINRCRDYKK